MWAVPELRKMSHQWGESGWGLQGATPLTVQRAAGRRRRGLGSSFRRRNVKLCRLTKRRYGSTRTRDDSNLMRSRSSGGDEPEDSRTTAAAAVTFWCVRWSLSSSTGSLEKKKNPDLFIYFFLEKEFLYWSRRLKFQRALQRCSVGRGGRCAVFDDGSHRLSKMSFCDTICETICETISFFWGWGVVAKMIENKWVNAKWRRFAGPESQRGSAQFSYNPGCCFRVRLKTKTTFSWNKGTFFFLFFSLFFFSFFSLSCL